MTTKTGGTWSSLVEGAEDLKLPNCKNGYCTSRTVPTVLSFHKYKCSLIGLIHILPIKSSMGGTSKAEWLHLSKKVSEA